MKRTGIDHPKTRRLAKLLGVPMFSAVGVLECLWHFTARHAIRGDIGRWSNHEIADAIGWPAEDVERLVSALLDTGWLDRDERHRLIVHDWHDHCDESVRKTVKKHGWQFVSRRDAVPVRESFATVPEQFANGREQVPTVPDSHSLSQSQSRSQSHSLSSPHGDGSKGERRHKSQSKPPTNIAAEVLELELLLHSLPDSDGAKGTTSSETHGKRKAAPKFSDDDMQLAQEMFAGIQALYPDAKPPNFDRWANSYRLLRGDGRDRTPDQIRATLAWVRADSFWKTNVLSPDKLREKWDTLQVKLREAKHGQRTKSTSATSSNGTYRAATDRRATF